jgi:hypothetical protein
VLADARGEHERLETAQGSDQRAQLANDAVDEKRDRLLAPGSEEARRARMSEEIPDTPSRPDFL